MKKITVILLGAFIFSAVNVIAGNREANAKSEAKASQLEITSIQSCILSGTIMDTENNEALAGATITIDGKKYYSDLDGRFNISALKPGKHSISVELISYNSSAMEVELQQNKNLVVLLAQK